MQWLPGDRGACHVGGPGKELILNPIKLVHFGMHTQQGHAGPFPHFGQPGEPATGPAALAARRRCRGRGRSNEPAAVRQALRAAPRLWRRRSGGAPMPLPPAARSLPPVHRNLSSTVPAEYGCYHPLCDVVATPLWLDAPKWVPNTLKLSAEELMAGKKR